MTNTSPFPGRPLSQEALKLIACLTMLIDHTGAVWVYGLFLDTAHTGGDAGAIYDFYELLRVIGRLAFPIYCFLLAEGAHYTRSPKRYALRLFLAALLSELPYDHALHNGFSWQNQNVMVTLLLGFVALRLMDKCPNLPLKLLCALPFALLAQRMNTDYGAKGVWLIVLFALTREHPHRMILQFFGMWCIFSPNHLMALNWLSGFRLTIQELAVLALIPISLYSGEKKSRSKTLQLLFYLFYPVHLTVLWILNGLFFG